VSAYERGDVRPGLVALGALSVFALIGVGAVVVALMFHLFGAAVPDALKPIAPAPRLESSDGEDRPALEAAAQAKIEGRIAPAMEKLVRQGWPP